MTQAEVFRKIYDHLTAAKELTNDKKYQQQVENLLETDIFSLFIRSNTNKEDNLSSAQVRDFRHKFLDLFQEANEKHAYQKELLLRLEAILRMLALHWPENEYCAFSGLRIDNLNEAIGTLDGYRIRKDELSNLLTNLPAKNRYTYERFNHLEERYFMGVAVKHKTMSGDASIPGFFWGAGLSFVGVASTIGILLATGALGTLLAPIMPALSIIGIGFGILTLVSLSIGPEGLIIPAIVAASPFLMAGGIGFGIGSLVNRLNGRPNLLIDRPSEDMDRLEELTQPSSNVRRQSSTGMVANQLNISPDNLIRPAMTQQKVKTLTTVASTSVPREQKIDIHPELNLTENDSKHSKFSPI